MLRVTLIHAYSTTNSGDGLLVEEAIDLVSEALPGGRVTVLALDPESFDDPRIFRTLHALTGSEDGLGSVQTLLRGATAFATGRRNAAVEKVIEESDIVIAVGGGYLRTKTAVEAVKTLFTHVVQLPRKSDLPPFIYLPQSIGPLNFGLKSIVLRRLRAARAVIARDDRSVEELGDLSASSRAPDMALLGLPDIWDPANVVVPDSARPVGLVARALSSSRKRVDAYRSSILALSNLPGFELLTQAAARGNNDPDFYESLGKTGPHRTLRAAVNDSTKCRPSVVVSVRLHGSIQTIRSGVPSIHLSYERKGWGAYDDLNISRFVHNAFDFDPALVADQVEELRTDPSQYWAALTPAIAELREARSQITKLVRDAVPERSSLA